MLELYIDNLGMSTGLFQNNIVSFFLLIYNCFKYIKPAVQTKGYCKCNCKDTEQLPANNQKEALFMEAHRKIPDCPVEMTLQLIGDKWKVLIIRDLMSGTKRFNELMRSVTGITQKVLTSHLRAMEQDGLLTRKVYPEVPPRVEYTLTETGRSLKPILDSMVAWGTDYKNTTAGKQS